MVAFENFLYNFDEETQHHIRWRCKFRDCSGRLYSQNDTVLLSKSVPHSNHPTMQAEIMKVKFKNGVKASIEDVGQQSEPGVRLRTLGSEIDVRTGVYRVLCLI